MKSNYQGDILQTHINVSWLKEAESCILFTYPVAAPKPDKKSLERKGFVLTLSLRVGRAWQGKWLWVWWPGCGAAATLCLQFWRRTVLQSISFLLTCPASWFGHTAHVYPLSETSLEICPVEAPWRLPLETCPGDIQRCVSQVILKSNPVDNEDWPHRVEATHVHQ